MGEPSTSHVVLPTPEYIGRVEGTRGSETSQYGSCLHLVRGGGVGVEPGGWGMWVGRGTLLGPEGSGGPLVMGGLCGCLVPPLAEPCGMCGVGGGWACCLRSA